MLNFKRNYPDLSFRVNPWLHFGNWHQSLTKGKNTFDARLPWITIDSLEWLKNYVKPGMRVFEYGMGGSTLFWLDKQCKVTGVEHDKAWFDNLMQILSRNEELDARFFAGAKPTGEDPGDLAFQSDFMEWEGLNFKSYVQTALDIPDHSLDIAMVDGRARVACVSSIRQKVKPGGILILDNSERPRYKSALDLLKTENWQVTHYPGPGLFQKHGFWCTSIFKKPDLRNMK